MGLASTTTTTTTTTLLSASFCIARRGFPPPRQTHHHHFRSLSTFVRFIYPFQLIIASNFCHRLYKMSANSDFKVSVCVQRKCNLNQQISLGKNRAEIVRCSAVEVEDEACELVNGVELSIGEGDDNIQAYLFKAVKNNNGAGVLLLSDIFGFQDSATRDFAYQVACHGYNSVLVPDLFRGDPWAKSRPKTMFEQWLSSQDPHRVANDIATSTKWMVDEFTAAGISNKLGIIGFCFGGGRVIDVLAADQGACFSTAVSFYGTRMDAAAASKIKVPILLISGDNDPLCPVSVLSEFKKIIDKGSKVVIFKGRGHAFAHRPGSLEEDEDAEQAFALMRNWLHNGLVVNS